MGKKHFCFTRLVRFWGYGIKNNAVVCKTLTYAEICGLAVPRQNNIGKSGFRDYILDKYIEKINHGYTVIVFVQEEKQVQLFVMKIGYILLEQHSWTMLVSIK